MFHEREDEIKEKDGEYTHIYGREKKSGIKQQNEFLKRHQKCCEETIGRHELLMVLSYHVEKECLKCSDLPRL